jgi:LacI family transcriptional regulator
MHKSKRTTLKDIAERLNVSVATISRALRNHPEISQRIKDQVNLLVESLHYRPNSFAVHLRKQHSGIIGVLIPKIVHHFSSTVISGIMAAAHEHKCQILISESGGSHQEEKENLWALINAGVDGLLVAISNHTTDETHFKEALNEGIPIVFFDKVPNDIKAIKVSTNDYKGAFDATEHLIQQGYKKIAHLRGQQGSRNALPRYNGYIDALKKYALPVHDSMVKVCTVCTEEEGYEYTLQMMAQKKKPDAFFCINDETAIGVLAALRHLKIKVPEEVGVVGFCDSKTALYTNPALTSVAQSGYDIGKIAIGMLLDSMAIAQEQNSIDEKICILEPTLIIRESTLKNGK